MNFRSLNAMAVSLGTVAAVCGALIGTPAKAESIEHYRARLKADANTIINAMTMQSWDANVAFFTQQGAVAHTDCVGTCKQVMTLYNQNPRKMAVGMIDLVRSSDGVRLICMTDGGRTIRVCQNFDTGSVGATVPSIDGKSWVNVD